MKLDPQVEYAIQLSKKISIIEVGYGNVSEKVLKAYIKTVIKSSMKYEKQINLEIEPYDWQIQELLEKNDNFVYKFIQGI